LTANFRIKIIIDITVNDLFVELLSLHQFRPAFLQGKECNLSRNEPKEFSIEESKNRDSARREALLVV
jgi:hypothetical protein